MARQRAKTIFHMELSFHRQESGFEHEIPLDIDVPEPDKLMSTRELATKFADRLPKSAQAIATQQAIVELKPVSPEDYFLRKAQTPRGLYWIKSTSPLPADDLTLEQAAIAYLGVGSHLGSFRSQNAKGHLLGHVRDVMGQALAQGGTSFDALYVNVNGESGYFDRSLDAYGQEGEPCRRCGTPIRRVAFMNRSSHFCPRCQRVR